MKLDEPLDLSKVTKKRPIDRPRWRVWTAILLRALAVVLALVVLAAIGKVAATRASAAVAALDAGAVVMRAELPPPSDASAPQPAPPPALPSASATPSVRASQEDPVFVNYASAEQLRRLPGVGPKRADAIIALRGRVGHFQRIEDLLRVKGIGRATLKKWRPLLRLDQPEGGVN